MSDRTITSWVEIPVRNLEKSKAFYDRVFAYDSPIMEMGPMKVCVLGGAMKAGGAHLFEGTPSRDGHIVHIALNDKLEDAMARCTDAGGELVGEPVQIPDGRYICARDIDGNAIGLFEAA